MKRALRSAMLITVTATALSACNTVAPQAFRVSATPLAEDMPVDAPVAFVETRLRRGNGVVFNRLGGEVPLGAPVEPVEERELGEIATPNAG